MMMEKQYNSIINVDNHHQQPESILIFPRVEQYYIFNALVILIKIMSLPLSSLLMWFGLTVSRLYAFSLIRLIQRISIVLSQSSEYMSLQMFDSI